MNTLIVLDEMRLLRENLETDIEIVGFTDNAQHHLCCMVVVLIFRHTAQVLVLIIVQGIDKPYQVGIPVTILGHDVGIVHIRQAVSLLVAL